MKNLMLLFVSLFVVLLGCEVVVRFMIKAWPFETALYVPNYLCAQELALRWRFSSSEGRNSLGLRNREVALKKEGVYRILFLGDSLVWSGETSSGELYTEVLEQRLNANSSKGLASYEVINAGIPGYTTYQELEFLRLYGFDMEPDLVILGFVFNDVYYKYFYGLTRGAISVREPSTRLHHFDTKSFPGTIFARSHLAHIIVRRARVLSKRIAQNPEFPFEKRGDFYLAWKDYGWTHVQNLLVQMQNLLNDKGVSFMVLVFPVSDQVNDKYLSLDEQYVLYPQAMITGVCTTHGIPMLDLTNSIYSNGGIGLFKDYLHLNPEGNDVVVNELEEYLVNGTGLIDLCLEIAPEPTAKDRRG